MCRFRHQISIAKHMQSLATELLQSALATITVSTCLQQTQRRRKRMQSFDGVQQPRQSQIGRSQVGAVQQQEHRPNKRCNCVLTIAFLSLGTLFYAFFLLIQKASEGHALFFLFALITFAIHFNRWALPNGSPPLDCARLFANDQKYIAEMAKRRIRRENDPPDDALEMSCEAIRSRNRFWHAENGTERAKREGNEKEEEEEWHGNYSLAQIRAVYKDYVLLEMELASTFSPLNWYCYVVDSASNALFKRRVQTLANCFPNVLIGDERKMESSGMGMMEATLDCFGRLTTAQRKWEYVSLLQNHDMAIKTRVQMAQIFAWMDGANDVDILPPGGRVGNIAAMDWSFTALNLFKNASRNSAAIAHGFPAHLMLAKGYFQVSLSRAMVEFIQRELNLTELVRRLNLIGYGRDEILFTTLHSADQLNAPGGFTQTCFSRKGGGRTNHLTRESLWMPNPSCASGHSFHSICMFGIEDLPQLATFPHLFVNKFLPSFDFGAAICMYERMFNMTYLNTGGEQLDKMEPLVNKSVVEQLPNVKFQRFKRDMLLRSKNNKQQKRGVDEKQLTFEEVMGFQCEG
ncbi:hypothetical protein niasHT_038354 [Heterodera trifolii]|uniref:Uncharacterized protein n=1 Tax=Heterodera trifolii TaxID=157864 RepID=A0ABD2IDZ0_9BILA